MLIENYNNAQDYAKIKRGHSKITRFIDEQFPPCNSSIGSEKFITKNDFRPNIKESRNVKWERAKVSCLFFKRDLFFVLNKVKFKFFYLKIKNLFSGAAHFVLDEERNYVNPKKINELNYTKYFRTTDLEQGLLGRNIFYFNLFM